MLRILQLDEAFHSVPNGVLWWQHTYTDEDGRMLLAGAS